MHFLCPRRPAHTTQKRVASRQGSPRAESKTAPISSPSPGTLPSPSHGPLAPTPDALLPKLAHHHSADVVPAAGFLGLLCWRALSPVAPPPGRPLWLAHQMLSRTQFAAEG